MNLCIECICLRMKARMNFLTWKSFKIGQVVTSYRFHVFVFYFFYKKKLSRLHFHCFFITIFGSILFLPFFSCHPHFLLLLFFLMCCTSSYYFYSSETKNRIECNLLVVVVLIPYVFRVFYDHMAYIGCILYLLWQLNHHFVVLLFNLVLDVPHFPNLCNLPFVFVIPIPP